ncbi:MAG: response regulator transcription factor [Anaerolineae bacterium]
MSEIAPIRILVVDDDQDTLTLIAECLEFDYDVVTASTPEQALALCRQQRFHLAMVDVRMPRISGLMLAPRLADLAPGMGIVVITAHAAVPDAVRAVRDLGALDYVPKPFSPAELRQRIRMALGRLDRARWLQLGDLTIHVQDRLVERDGEPLPLTSREFEMLLAIACNQEHPLSYEQLLRQVWGSEPHAGHRELLRSAMKRLRCKLGDDATEPRYIQTVRGMGYRAVVDR